MGTGGRGPWCQGRGRRSLIALRRWSRRLTLFYKVINNLTPDYTRDPLPPLHQVQYSFRERDTIGQIRARTEKHKSSFYPHCLSEWNKLDPEIKLSSSVAVFKTKMLSKICPLQNLCLAFMTQRACLILLNSGLVSAS